MCISQGFYNVQHDAPDSCVVDCGASCAVCFYELVQVAVEEFSLDVDFWNWPLVCPTVLDLDNVGMI
jgi:hypothetical protein